MIKKLLTKTFGRKYYANIINWRGTDRTEITSSIFRTKKEAIEHRKSIESTLSFTFVETVSFRSRVEY